MLIGEFGDEHPACAEIIDFNSEINQEIEKDLPITTLVVWDSPITMVVEWDGGYK